MDSTNYSLESTHFEFLGTMAGKQTYLKGNDNEPTYARVYEPFGGSDDLIKAISTVGYDQFGRGYKKIGDNYSYTPIWHGTCFSSKPTSMPGGGFFLTVKKFDIFADQQLNCFAYALGTFGSKLERLAESSMKEIQESVKLTIDHIVDRYFTNVVAPEDGDLAVYSISPGKKIRTPGDQEVSGTTHAGIYRKSNPNWHSPEGGTIESKWGWLANPYVFQHDVFFAPDFYGNQVKFFRIKKLD